MHSNAAPPRGGRRRVIAGLTAVAMALFTAVVASPGAATAAPTPTWSAPADAGSTATSSVTPAGCAIPAAGPSTKRYAQCFAQIVTAAKGTLVPYTGAPPAAALGPADIQSAYSLPAGGAGQTVAIVDAFGYANAEADLAAFRSYYGLPACTSGSGCFIKVDQNGGTNYPAENSGWALETALDLDAVSSACPACHILLVEGNDNSIDSLGAAVNTAVALGAKFVSNSYGVPGEDPSETSLDDYYTHPGVAVTASTGDTGNVTNWPATNPNVVAVGGTSLTRDSSSRGWHESAWGVALDGQDGAGSGCSPYEPKPDYQQGIGTACDKRAIADISADADPYTGLAVYDTSGQSGWLQIGGTSLASPLVAAMYALAGTPVAGTFPVTYPYAAPLGTLNDVTQGTNGACGNVLCQAGAGWDGPTGLGTPHGVVALSPPGPHGHIVGTVTDDRTGAPVAGATVSTAGGVSVTTDASGHYDLNLAVGSYDLTASAFAYKSKTITGVSVVDGTSVTVDLKLAAVPRHTLSGTVTDAAHGWPLYAKVTVGGLPGGTSWTDPFTGRYSFSVPEGFTANLAVEPVSSGPTPAPYAVRPAPSYPSVAASVEVTTADKVKDFGIKADETSCAAPGYTLKTGGSVTTFTGWTGTTPRDGWTQVDNLGYGDIWDFDDSYNRAFMPGDYAVLDSVNDYLNALREGRSVISQDASLVSPVIDLTKIGNPTIQFDTWAHIYNAGTKSDVDLSLDGGATWTTVWSLPEFGAGILGHVGVPIPQAAGVATARVRFHFAGNDQGWGVDNVVVGTRTCEATPGGLVAGFVTDHNTGAGLSGATVGVDSTGESGVSAATPEDPGLGDGFYEVFAPAAGVTLTAAGRDLGPLDRDARYTPGHATATVSTNAVTRQDVALGAGHLSITPDASVTETLGANQTTTVKLTNDGTQPVHVQLGEQNPSSSATSWTSIASYPTTIYDNAVAYLNGKVYSVGGFDGSTVTATGYVFDPAAGAWSRIVDAPQARQGATAAALGGKVYLLGGLDSLGNVSTKVYVYDPATNQWGTAADLPSVPGAAHGLADMGVAVADGNIYLVGGCPAPGCGNPSNKVFKYTPTTNAWSVVANYPVSVGSPACAGLSGAVVCAGGHFYGSGGLKETYIYNPTTDTWSQGADLPIDDGLGVYASAASGANGRLQVVGGSVNFPSGSIAVTDHAWEYDPATNSWASLPNLPYAERSGAGACGMYAIGGNTDATGNVPTRAAQVLSGHDQCGTPSAVDVPWLSADTTQADIAPGGSVTVKVSMDSSKVDQPGVFTAGLSVSTDTPYADKEITTTMTVNPPAAWGKLVGTVTDAATGKPVPGATVRVGSLGGNGDVTYTLRTGADGTYSWWLDARYSPLQVIISDDGYYSQVTKLKITRQQTTTQDFALKKLS